jgi:hypothetical protein
MCHLFKHMGTICFLNKIFKHWQLFVNKKQLDSCEINAWISGPKMAPINIFIPLYIFQALGWLNS